MSSFNSSQDALVRSVHTVTAEQNWQESLFNAGPGSRVEFLLGGQES